MDRQRTPLPPEAEGLGPALGLQRAQSGLLSSQKQRHLTCKASKSLRSSPLPGRGPQPPPWTWATRRGSIGFKGAGWSSLTLGNGLTEAGAPFADSMKGRQSREW